MYRIFLMFLLVSAGVVAGDWNINGAIRDANSSIPVLAHVHVSTLNGTEHTTFRTIRATTEGKFRVRLSSPGWYKLWFTSPGHVPTPVVVQLLPEETNLSVTVTLPPYPYNEPLENLKIVGDWENFSFSKAAPMTKMADGTFVYSLTAERDTLSYQILGAAGKRSINGTQQDYNVYDGRGDYRSVLKTRPGEAVRIIFDPDKRIQTEARDLPRVIFDDRHLYLIQINKLYHLFTKTHKAFLKEAMAYQQQHFNLKGFEYDFSGIKTKLDQFLKSDNESERRFAAILLIDVELKVHPPDKARLRTLWDTLTPADPLWEMSPFAASVIPFILFPQHQDSVLEELVRVNPSRLVRATALARLTALLRNQNKQQAFLEHYQKLTSEYGDVPEIQYDIKNLNPEKRIATGKPVPDFEVKLLDSGKMVTNNSLLGSYYLIDFWAVWCMPCVAEIPNLKEAYEQFKDKNFEILSISLDADDEIVHSFWEKKYKMPWLNARAEGRFDSPVARAFEVQGIPRPILVGPDGTIIATGSRLRGKMLLNTLSEILTQETDDSESQRN